MGLYPLAQAFLSAGGRCGGLDPAALERALAEIEAAARHRWPGVELPGDELARALGTRLPEATSLDAALTQIRPADIYLACAAGRADPVALRAVESLLEKVEPAVRAVLSPGDAIDDVMQTVREYVLLAPPERPAHIEAYAGRSELRLWLRVIAVRTALGLRRQRKRELAVHDAAALYLPEVASDEALEQAKQTYQSEFRDAFAEALAALSDRERSLLAQQFVDGLGVGDIASIYSIHRDTAARWIARARAKLYAATRHSLMSRLKLDRSEFDSILRLIRSRLDVTFRDLLAG